MWVRSSCALEGPSSDKDNSGSADRNQGNRTSSTVKAGPTSPALWFSLGVRTGREIPHGEALVPHLFVAQAFDGSSCEAREAGTVPKMIPTMEEIRMAMIADKPEIGTR